MDANKAKWYGILATFVVALLQMIICFGLISMLFLDNLSAISKEEINSFLKTFTRYSDFFIPILFFSCLRWSKKIGQKVIIEKKDAYEISLDTLNAVLAIAYTLTTIACIIYVMVEAGHYDVIYDSLSNMILGLFGILVCGLLFIRLFNYLPSAVGALLLSNFLKRYQ